MATKYLTPAGRELKEAAAAFVAAHPAGSGRRHKAKLLEVEKRVAAAS